MKRSLTRQERITSKSDIARVFRRGRSVSTRGARLVCAPNNLDYSRFVVTTTRGFAGAVQRNRARRIGKEIIRLAKADIAGGMDIVLILYPGDYDFRDRDRQISTLLARAGLQHGLRAGFRASGHAAMAT